MTETVPDEPSRSSAESTRLAGQGSLRRSAEPVDVLVVGGGPAGLAVAIRAARQGFEVVVVDRATPPIDKACGEGLMPDGVALLDEMGVELAADSHRAFAGIRYLDGEVVAEGRFPGSPGKGIRRVELHRAMVRGAQEAGADLRWGVKVTGLAGDGVDTDHGRLAARFVVAADGLKSRLRGWANLGEEGARLRRFGVRRHFAVEPWSDCVEVYWAEGCEAYVTPVSRHQVGVAMLWAGESSSFDALLARFPALAGRLDGAPVESRDRGAGPFEQRSRAVVRGNLALVGDASGYLDPITGDGVTIAFHQAAALVAAIRRNDLGLYAARHRRVNRLPSAIARLLLEVEARPRLRRRVIRALAAEPGLFSRILGVHARQLPARRVGLLSVLRLIVRVALQ